MPHARLHSYQQMPILSPKELTGRARTHVMELAEPRCTLHPAALEAFVALRAAAARDAGIDLAAASSFRDFEQQRAIWNGKYTGQRSLLDHAGMPLHAARMEPERIVRAILHWSALPGASRHHWGTDLDVIDRAALSAGQRAQLLPSEYAPTGVFSRLARWLAEHAEDYGFFLPYDRYRGGVQPEPWHLSYAPVSNLALSELTVELLAAVLEEAELEGADIVLRDLPQIHARYVAAVAPANDRALAAVRLSPAARPS
jgi:LAS superfamily LD-carboxypeptidase LdcB